MVSGSSRADERQSQALGKALLVLQALQVTFVDASSENLQGPQLL